MHLSSADAGRLEGLARCIPEVPHVAGDDAPNLAVALDYARFYGLRSAAVFYDLIPLRQPGYESMAAAHERYVRALVAVDILLAISAHSASDLRSWWTEQGYEDARLPPVVALPLPDEVVGIPRATRPDDPRTADPLRRPRHSRAAEEPGRGDARVRAALRPPTRPRPATRRRRKRPPVADAVGRDRRVARSGSGCTGSCPIPTHGNWSGRARDGLHVACTRASGCPSPRACGKGSRASARTRRDDRNRRRRRLPDGSGCPDGAAIELRLERLADDASLRERLALGACARCGTWNAITPRTSRALRQTPAPRQLVVIEGSSRTRRRRLQPRRCGGCGSPAALATRRPRAAAGRRGARGAHGTGSRTAPRPLGSGAAQRAQQPPGRCRDIAGCRPWLRPSRRAWSQNKRRRPCPRTRRPSPFPTDVGARRRARGRAVHAAANGRGFASGSRVGAGADALPAIAKSLPRTASAAPPRRPSRIFYWVGLTVTQPFNTGVQRVTRLLAAALQRSGIDVVPVKWDDGHVGGGADNRRRGGAPCALERSDPSRRNRCRTYLAGEWMLVPGDHGAGLSAGIERGPARAIGRHARRGRLLRPYSRRRCPRTTRRGTPTP